MLRFIVKNSFKHEYTGMEGNSFITIDNDLKELENQLKKGGFSESGYDRYELIGIEIIDDTFKEEE